MCAAHKWVALRLDGSCNVKSRQAMVDTFNNPKVLGLISTAAATWQKCKACTHAHTARARSPLLLCVRTQHPSFVLLLSSKAGGTGLNIIGANRLVLFDPGACLRFVCMAQSVRFTRGAAAGAVCGGGNHAL